MIYRLGCGDLVIDKSRAPPSRPNMVTTTTEVKLRNVFKRSSVSFRTHLKRDRVTNRMRWFYVRIRNNHYKTKIIIISYWRL